MVVEVGDDVVLVEKREVTLLWATPWPTKESTQVDVKAVFLLFGKALTQSGKSVFSFFLETGVSRDSAIVLLRTV